MIWNCDVGKTRRSPDARKWREDSVVAAFLTGIVVCLIAANLGATKWTLLGFAVIAFALGLALVFLSTRDTARARFFGALYLGLACAVTIAAHVLCWARLPLEIARAIGDTEMGLFPMLKEIGIMAISLYLTIAFLVFPWWRYVLRWRELRRNVHARVSVRDCE